MRRTTTILILMLLCTIAAQAQVYIGGSVYGGGNAGTVNGSTSVTVREGDIDKVFGGARMANIGGNTYVHVDGKEATGYTVINYLFGGNDIGGKIGTAAAVGEELPKELEGNTDGVDNTWNIYVHLSSKVDEEGKIADDAQKTYIGQLFAGGNGDYTYKDEEGDSLKDEKGDYAVKSGETVVATWPKPFVAPEVAKTYLDVQGGSIVYAYGGGNNVTVTEKTVIHVDNPSKVVNHILVDAEGKEADSDTYEAYEDDEADGTIPTGYSDLLSPERFKYDMGINTTFSFPSSGEFQIGRFFGGNNLAEMAIRPTWNLQSGMIRNLYSGGNRGNMTSPEGLLLEIPATSTIVVDNLFGGCRMADVIPTVNGVYTPCLNLPGYNFPNELSARVLIRGGDVNNVYGGNDVTGTVHGGNAIGIYASVRGDVYGGGNGAYPYTNVEEMAKDSTYRDFYYPGASLADLNAFRPNAEQVSIRLAGTAADDPTIIRGSVYVGGNCATLKTQKSNPLVELKIGSHVIADKVFLGNNGEMMVYEPFLELYKQSGFSTYFNLTGKDDFAKYMEGVAMTLQPHVAFDAVSNGDPATYIDYSSYVGSFYCGGNKGSMAIGGKNTYSIERGLNIFEKFVGGCNDANVPAEPELNAAYEGGVLGTASERPDYLDESGKIKDRLEIDFRNMTIVPKRWNEDKSGLEWNTYKWDTTERDFVKVANDAVDADTRLLGGNVYGGCYTSGHVNGNVVININDSVLNKNKVFAATAEGGSGVDYDNQRDDIMTVAMSVFGAGYGEATEIWGSTTVNLNDGFAFQIFGGGEMGVVGKRKVDANNVPIVDEEGNYTYDYDPRYSSTVNLKGATPVFSNDGKLEDLAESEYIYGGGSEGDVAGNTYVYLGNGRIYDAFGGASDAEILGHTEVHIGQQPDENGGLKDGFPWVKDIVYGGNDFGGKIHGNYPEGYSFTALLRNASDASSLHGYKSGSEPDVLKGSTYVEYLQGRVDTIFGGGYGYYNYSDTELYGTDVGMPVQHSSFVNIRPNSNENNAIKAIFGGGTGFPGNRHDDRAQDRSYVLIDIPDGVKRFQSTEVFGSGSYNGLGMATRLDTTTGETVDDENNPIDLDEASAIVDLLHGRIHNVYGGSYNEGITRRTVVNVPAASSIQLDSIFGGAYGTQILPPCDVYETQVNYKNTSENAQVFGAIFGGNNHERRSLFTQVNISSPVWQNKEKGYTGTVYGAGRGIDTWSEHTEVNLLKGARVYNVYGGGEMGHVLNSESVQQYMKLFKNGPSEQIARDDPYWSKQTDMWEDETNRILKASFSAKWKEDWDEAWTIGEGTLAYYTPNAVYDNYASNAATNLSRFSNRPELDDDTAESLNGKNNKKFNTNVIINQGAVVEGYAYGGGLGNASELRTGDVYGSTYVTVLGGEVRKDVYGGGRAGGLDDLFNAGYTASANVFIKGGTTRNVYGGGYEGHVGHHEGNISTTYIGDRLANANVVIGTKSGTTFNDGVPAITRNAYGGGEGGSVYGTSKITLNNGYIGYRAVNTGTADKPVYNYVQELNDQKPNDLELGGNVFGGGYVVNSYVDSTNVFLYGGTVRGSVYGGGEIGPVGRGTMKTGSYTTGVLNGAARIFRAGSTHVNMYDGHVLRNVFGGGRGKDSWGGDGTMYMDPALVATLDMKCKGFVFGQTTVNIFGGEVGTDEGVAQGLGNVFGGGDEGSVYSAYMEGNKLYIGKKDGKRYNEGLSPGDPGYGYQGYYYKWDPNLATPAFITHNTGTESSPKLERSFTEDCKVLVEPHCKVKNNVDIDKTYKTGEFVPTDALNKLKGKDDATDKAKWDHLETDGIIIHNAVFAGGNIASGSSSMYANEKTVFGNATATIHDIYNRDLITIGTGHTGGLYGDGNLTFVDGYRELNITNYGTDYYHISKQITLDDYKKLLEREQAYYELKYKCVKSCQDIEETTYSTGTNVPLDELLVLFTTSDGKSVMDGSDSILVTVGGKKVPNPAYWEENGVVSTYAGRIMNTIQRADFCGVFGSRMVMKGAQDRVPEEVDYTNYTINRVREVSLNKMESKAGDTDDDNRRHGNYFGIYSIVNYLGALTSDIDFNDSIRTTNADLEKYPDLDPKNKETFAEWKALHKDDKMRNNGTCYNQLALASGVYLELTTEESTGIKLDEKVWGPITGVVELDLINVQPGIGGGFVYAKNQHGVRSPSGNKTTTLTAHNDNAVTQWDYIYTDETGVDPKTNIQKEWQTSGNFIHSSQTIIDDCYNVSGRYKLGENPVPAHYWFISGSVYVYDQYISAYTGAPNAYSKTVEMPITINAASHGTMTLMDVQPNLYAYYTSYVNESSSTKLGDDQKMVINNVTYHLNDPINYWDWNKLSKSEQRLFVPDTYVLMDSCKVGDNYYPAGYVMLPGEYESLKLKAATTPIDLTPKDEVDNAVPVVLKATVGSDNNPAVVTDDDGNPVYAAFADLFRSSNNMSHMKGYLLTYNVTNPSVWNKWYTQVKDKEENSTYVLVKDQVGGDGFEDGPTYFTNTPGLYGQKSYEVNAIISQDEYNKYNGYDADGNGDYTDAGDVYGLKQAIPGSYTLDGQATFVPAHIITKEYTADGAHYYPGAPVKEAYEGYTAPAYVCTNTIQLSETDYIYINDLMTESQRQTYLSSYPDMASDIRQFIVPAYYCTEAGLYGGNYYEDGKNYRALEAWSSMSENDRQQFEFNYDALDLLIDSTYSGTLGRKYQYDSSVATLEAARQNPATYSLKTPIDYTATYNSNEAGTEEISLPEGMKVCVTHTGSETPDSVTTIVKGDELNRTAYESLPNEQRHYAPIKVKPDQVNKDIYVVKEEFVHIETPYAVGTVIDEDSYEGLTSTEKSTNIAKLKFTDGDMKKDEGYVVETTFYYCREDYEMGYEPDTLTITGNTTGGIVTREDSKQWVTVGTIIPETASTGSKYGYTQLPNYQKNFTIHGVSPMETSTLYVSRNSDINDLSKEKIITVIYKYDYEESDVTGMHITPVSERHIVNIHITFKSGVPTVPDIQEPSIVLPGTSLTMRTPVPTPGAYEILGGGWELFETPSDAESHTNGVPYTPTVDSLYWYQDGYQLAYYAKTYLGKTYSNHVPVHVANYHDLKNIMDDKKYHLHVDYDRTRLKRDSKIYINDYSASSQNGLDLFKDLYDLSLLTSSSTSVTNGVVSAEGRLNGHRLLNTVNGPQAGRNLEFFLRTDIDHSSSSWTPIASGSDPCFDGVLHGDGHTISGLTPADGTTGSLFSKLCGEVYNLGVTGSFTGAGVADNGSGYVESAWVKSTAATTPLETKPYAVFGDPSDDTGYQVVNSYFWEGNASLYNTSTTDGITTSGGQRGKARAMSERAFYNGEVAYDLNNFYLYKRYSDRQTAGGDGKVVYRYLTIGEDNKPVLQEKKYYDSHPDLCSSGHVYTEDGKKYSLAYVEDRFTDGDYRYAAGEIPTAEDERRITETVKDPLTGKDVLETDYLPIWPDDYIFFGQKLTYGWAPEAHQDHPSAVMRSDGRLETGETGNRVYRAPAYYRSKTMDVAYFNPDAYLAFKSADGTKSVSEKPMTAIDFAGHNDLTWNLPSVPGGGSAFYAPLLDDDGLTAITNCDETKNLLVYAPATDANAKTHSVLTAYFTEPAFNESYDNTNDYNIVRAAPTLATPVNGHLVQSSLTATNDHLLIDKQDFNAPIAYEFDSSHRMWYQRTPDSREYVDRTKGWQDISIPFTADLVTTHQKGEITHFYSGSDNSANSDSKVGHEYWLRNLQKLEADADVIKGTFNYPDAADADKTVSNTFLWDYYYKNEPVHNQKDKNADTYLQYKDYYRNARTHKSYPLLTSATPYILGLPGSTYYEFDLSGNFTAQNTAVAIDKLSKQIVTFASKKGEHIGVSDDDTTAVAKTVSGNKYSYKPNYMNEDFTDASNAYAMNNAGNAYDKITTAETVSAFRPYFIVTSVPSGARPVTRSIVFTNDGEDIDLPHDTHEKEEPGTLIVSGGKHKIIVRSTMNRITTVRIVNAAGITLNTFDIEPGETIETRVTNAAVYMVQSTDGKFIKKIAIK